MYSTVMYHTKFQSKLFFFQFELLSCEQNLVIIDISTDNKAYFFLASCFLTTNLTPFKLKLFISLMAFSASGSHMKLINLEKTHLK